MSNPYNEEDLNNNGISSDDLSAASKSIEKMVFSANSYAENASNRDSFTYKANQYLKAEYERTHGAPLQDVSRGPSNERLKQALSGQTTGSEVTISQGKVVNRRNIADPSFVAEAVKDGFIQEMQESEATQGKHRLDSISRVITNSTGVFRGYAMSSNVHNAIHGKNSSENLLSNSHTTKKYRKQLTSQDLKHEQLLSKATGGSYVTGKQASELYKQGYTNAQIIAQRKSAILDAADKQGINLRTLSQTDLKIHIKTMQNTALKEGNLEKAALLNEYLKLEKLEERNNFAQQKKGGFKAIAKEAAQEAIGQSDAMHGYSTIKSGVVMGRAAMKATGLVGGAMVSGTLGAVRITGKGIDKGMKNLDNIASKSLKGKKLEKWQKFSDGYIKISDKVKVGDSKVRTFQSNAKKFKDEAKATRGLKKVGLYAKTGANTSKAIGKWVVNTKPARFVVNTSKAAGKWMVNTKPVRFIVNSAPVRAMHKFVVNRIYSPFLKASSFIGKRFTFVKNKVIGIHKNSVAFKQKAKELWQKTGGKVLDKIFKPFNMMSIAMEHLKKIIFWTCATAILTVVAALMIPVAITAMVPSSALVYADGIESPAQMVLNNIWGKMEDYQEVIVNGTDNAVFSGITLPEIRTLTVVDETDDERVDTDSLKTTKTSVQEGGLKEIYETAKYEGSFEIEKEVKKLEQVQTGTRTWTETVELVGEREVIKTKKEWQWVTKIKKEWQWVQTDTLLGFIPIFEYKEVEVEYKEYEEVEVEYVDTEEFIYTDEIEHSEPIMETVEVTEIEYETINRTVDGPTNIDGKNSLGKILTAKKKSATSDKYIIKDTSKGISEDNIDFQFKFVGEDATNYSPKEFFTQLLACAVVATDNSDDYNTINSYVTALFNEVMETNSYYDVVVRFKDSSEKVKWYDYEYTDEKLSDKRVVGSVEIVFYVRAGIEELMKLDPNDTVKWYEDKDKTVKSDRGELAVKYAANEELWEMLDLYFPGGMAPTLSDAEIERIIGEIRDNLSHGERLSEDREKLIKTALENVGRFYYSWGGGHAVLTEDNPPTGLDCSGFMSYILWQGGVDESHNPRNCVGIMKSYTRKSYSGQFHELDPGDLLFQSDKASTQSTANHVIMYLGKFCLIEGDKETLKEYCVECTPNGFGDFYNCSGSQIYDMYGRETFGYRTSPFDD